MYKTILTLLGITSLSFLFMSNDTGVATEAGKDRTGSPFNATGGLQCNACHSGGAFATNISTELRDTSGAVVTEYLGGATYTYTVTVSSTGAAKHGFQALALITSSNANAGTLSASSPNCKIKVLSTTRRYAEHTSPSVSGTFTMTWIAPAPGSGTVKFYAAGNGVDGNGLKTGDKASSATVLTINESALSGIGENAPASISIYPNPVSDFVNITPSFNGNVQILLTSINGKCMVKKQETFVTGFVSRVDMNNLDKGTYLLSIVDEKGKLIQTAKIIK